MTTAGKRASSCRCLRSAVCEGPQFAVSRRSSVAVGPEAAKSGVL